MFYQLSIVATQEYLKSVSITTSEEAGVVDTLIENTDSAHEVVKLHVEDAIFYASMIEDENSDVRKILLASGSEAQQKAQKYIYVTTDVQEE